MSGEEQRRHNRVEMRVDVEMVWPYHMTLRLYTRDLSHGGAFLESKDQPIPPVGTEITLKALKPEGDGEEPPVIKAKVVRITADGFAVEFIA